MNVYHIECHGMYRRFILHVADEDCARCFAATECGLDVMNNDEHMQIATAFSVQLILNVSNIWEVYNVPE